MRERPSARVVLLDPEGRIALMRGRLPGASRDELGAWFTVGGGLEPGESLAEAAVREVREETGLEASEVGPVIWLREGVFDPGLGSGPLYFKESYIVARCDGGELSRDGWLAHEQDFCTDLRWWTREELLATTDNVYPQRLAMLLEDVLDGRLPESPLSLPW
ncbi:NUDIX hydrolase [Phenylobacterium immobile]|uniref:NUDIX hydrolase n=1 Tax=Phenylobacterium immobile TaxID=21 RepID=UPI000ADBE9C0|nr:NUDIX domain-containing protein [Phenylobacterium immobile]